MAVLVEEQSEVIDRIAFQVSNVKAGIFSVICRCSFISYRC